MESVCKELYQKLAMHKREYMHKNVIATIIDGTCAGAKIYLSDGEVMWTSKENTALIDMKEQLSDISGFRLFESESGRIFCEEAGSCPVLVICGAGHVSIPLICLGKSIGFYIVVLEDRRSFAENARRAGADEIICESFESGMDGIRGTPDTYFVIVTREHRCDKICLKHALEKECAYVGMMGSRKRVKIVKEQLCEEGILRELLEQVHTPIGLSIGAETPEEIAVSIMAEIIQVKNSIGRREGYTEEMLSYLTGEKEGCNDKQKVLAVIVSRNGSAPRKVGTKMLILEDELCIGTIGGGYAEAEIKKESLQMMEEGDVNQKLITVSMNGREAKEAGMVCGGTIEVYLEKV